MSSGRGKRTYDHSLLLAVSILVILGLVMVYSATFHLRSDATYYVKRQFLWTALGVGLLWAASHTDYRLLRQLALPIMALSFLSLLAVLFVGPNVNNTQSWFATGSIQPSEFAKLAFIIYIAAWLDSKGEKIRDVTYGLVPFAILLGVVTGLILLQPDRGTALLIASVAVTMFFVSGAEMSQVLTGVVVGGGALLLVLVRSDYTLDRLLLWLNPTMDPSGAGFQLRGVLSAIRAGGITGRGLGAGLQKFIPPYVYHTDTILSVVGEELGLLGCLVLMGLFAYVTYRGLAISFRAPDAFSTMLAFGITCWIVLQALVHIGGNTAALPFTGITLPFVSYGGSSMTMTLGAVGVLLSISREAVERKVSVATFAFGWRNRRPRLSNTRSGRRTQARRKRERRSAPG